MYARKRGQAGRAIQCTKQMWINDRTRHNEELFVRLSAVHKLQQRIPTTTIHKKTPVEHSITHYSAESFAKTY